MFKPTRFGGYIGLVSESQLMSDFPTVSIIFYTHYIFIIL